MSRTMTLVFKGGATLDVPLADQGEVNTKRYPTEGFTSVSWKNGAGVSLLTFEPKELAAVMVRESAPGIPNGPD